MNAEFQKIARRAKKKKKNASSVTNAKKQRKTMGKTRDLFKKIRDTKGTFHAKMGTIKETVWTEQKQKILRGSKNTQKKCIKNIFTNQIP